MRRYGQALWALTGAWLWLCGCESTPPPAPPPPQPQAPPPAPPPGPPQKSVALTDVGLDPTALDRNVDPCQDFFQYACGGWLQKTEIPADRSRWGRGSEIAERNQLALKAILEEASSKPGGDTATQAIGTFYGACMNEEAVEAAGTKGVDPLLKKARSVRDVPSLVAAVAELHRQGVFPLFLIGSEQDAKDATRVIARLDQGGLGLPDRDYYVNDDDKSKGIRAKYVEHLNRMMALAGKKPAEAKKAADDIMAVETELARASKTRVERRDPSGMYNKVDRPGVAKLAPKWGWDAYFKGLGFADLRDINVTAPAFLQGLEKLLASTKPAAWQAYLEWHVLNATADALPKKFADERFSMQQVLTGQKKQRERWKRCVAATDAALGEALGQPYVARHFAGESRDAAQQMVLAISQAFGERVGELDWMDEKTKERARDKRQQMAYLIGYPGKWRTYDFALDKKVYAANVLGGQAFEMKRQLTKVGKPVDREDWQMSPPTVNAYYDPQLNHMAFPAGILQPPMYSARSAVAVNLGAIGMVVGHELTHGFDDEGSQYDAKGNLASWWQPETKKRFEAKTQCVADQYSAYEPVPGVKLNGKLTLGENIADIGGLKLAFRAYRAMRKGAQEHVIADGLTEDQQFFVSYGQSWCSKDREEFARMLAQTDPHSPPKFRVNGVVTNSPEFASAFSCSEGKALSPRRRCDVWLAPRDCTKGAKLPPGFSACEVAKYRAISRPLEIARLAWPYDRRPMEQIGDYLVRRLLGQGGMGRVYEAEERLSGRRVALKVLLPELAASDEGRRLFLNEMRVLARLEHPNLVRSLASFEADGQLVLVLEYLEGRTLRDVVSAGRAPWGEAVQLIGGIASALAAIHAQSPPVVHRDLKPENVMVLPGGAIKVMDFGIAKVLEALQRTHTHSVGTLQYMSPEQIDARALDGRSDLYCLGLIFYELLAGEPPFRSPSPRELLNLHCTAQPPPLRDEVRRGLPKGLEALLFQLLEKSPSARPASSHEVLGKLEPFLPAVSSLSASPSLGPSLPSAQVMTSPPYDPTLPSPPPENRAPSYASAAPSHHSAAPAPSFAQAPPQAAPPFAPSSPAPSNAAPAPGAGQRAPSNETLALLDPIDKGRLREAPRALGVAIIVALTLLAGGVGYWLRASSPPDSPPDGAALDRPAGRVK